jgi:hypothetical protein
MTAAFHRLMTLTPTQLNLQALAYAAYLNQLHGLAKAALVRSRSESNSSTADEDSLGQERLQVGGTVGHRSPETETPAQLSQKRALFACASL